MTEGAEPLAAHRRLAAVTPLSRPIAVLLLAALLLAASLVGGCAGGIASPAPASAAPTPAGSGSGSGAGSGGSGIAGGGGGSVEGNPGTFGAPVPVPPPGSGDTGGTVPSPSPTEVHPVGGLLSIHDVPATAVRAAMSGDHLVAQVFWWSGPPPCSELAGVATARSGDTFMLTVREGAVQLGIACPALAMYKVTTVDLGPVSAATYTVKALGVDVGAVVVYGG